MTRRFYWSRCQTRAVRGAAAAPFSRQTVDRAVLRRPLGIRRSSVTVAFVLKPGVWRAPSVVTRRDSDKTLPAMGGGISPWLGFGATGPANRPFGLAAQRAWFRQLCREFGGGQDPSLEQDLKPASASFFEEGFAIICDEKLTLGSDMRLKDHGIPQLVKLPFRQSAAVLRKASI